MSCLSDPEMNSSSWLRSFRPSISPPRQSRIARRGNQQAMTFSTTPIVCLTLAKWETVSGRFGGYLIKHFPSIYKNAASARWYFNRHVGRIPLRLKTRTLLMLREPIAFNIGGAMGLGAILTHAAHALRVGKAHGVDVALRFTSPI